MGRLENKVAVITGATSGIGEAVAGMYVKEGAKVVAAGRNREKGEQLISELEQAGGEAIFCSCDLRKKESIADLKEKSYDRFGKVDPE
ncbi:MAG: SDR family oxidoreductase [Lachnospiraceae bacterium]|nr:SDR family oxidoreductase [Lachnospiraceae bacterium]